MFFTDLYAKYNCTYCQEEISGVRIKCAECPDFDICLQVKLLGRHFCICFGAKFKFVKRHPS